MIRGIVEFFAALFGGILIALINYYVSRRVLKLKPDLFSAISILHQVLNVGYMLALYFISIKTGANVFRMLVGGAFGITLPMLYSVPKLIKLGKNDKNDNNDNNDNNGNNDNTVKDIKTGSED